MLLWFEYADGSYGGRLGRLTREGLVPRDPSRAVKLVPRVVPPPRQLSDKEGALVAAVERCGSPRDLTLMVVALHTGLRAEELCGLAPTNVKMAKRSGRLEVWGKRGKHREVPGSW